MPTFLSNTDFLDKLKNVFKNPKFWAPALAATVGAGAIGGISAGLSKRKIETPRQRRRRILRSILLPSLLTAGAAGLGGIGLAAANLDSLQFSSEEDRKAEDAVRAEKERTNQIRDSLLNKSVDIGGLAAHATAAGVGGLAGYGMNRPAAWAVNKVISEDKKLEHKLCMMLK